MHTEKLGTKRTCGSCQAKFYDLSKDPIECPKCHWHISLSALAKQSEIGAKKASKEKEKDIAPDDIGSESLVDYELNEEGDFAEDLLIESEKDDEEEDDRL